MRTQIITNRLRLRTWQEKDVQPLAEMNQDPEVMRFFPNKLSFQESYDMLQKLVDDLEKNGFGVWVVEDKTSRMFLGFTGFLQPSFESFFTPCVEIGWRFVRTAWGKGFASEAAHACLAYGFNELAFDEVYAFTSVLNVKSENVMKRLGMKRQSEFEHPRLNKEDKLCEHVLYRIRNEEFYDIT